jgi:hypothetical protein
MARIQGVPRDQAGPVGRRLDERLKLLVELKGAQMIGCEWCLDLGSQICRNSGLSDEELLAVVDYGDSAFFTAREKPAIDYTVAVMRTPVEVTDELFARMREHFSDEQLVELTAFLAMINLDRFNAAFGIGPAGDSEGMVCVPPAPARREGSPGRGLALGRESNRSGAHPTGDVSRPQPPAAPPVGHP